MRRKFMIAGVLTGLTVTLFFAQNFSTLDSNGTFLLDEQALVTCPRVGPAPEGTYSFSKDVVYTRKISQIPNQLQAFDYSRPLGTKLRPLLIVIHGGGWQFGSKDEAAVKGLSARLVGKGFAVANFNYPLVSPVNGVMVNQFPIPIQGLRCGLRYLNKNAAALGIDKSRVVVYGGSAGGNLAGLVAYAGEDTSGVLDSPDCEHKLQPLLPIKGAILNSGVYALRVDTAFDRPGARAYLGDPACDPLQEPELPACRDLRWAKAAFASPRQYIKANSPPAFALHSLNDQTVNYDQLQVLVRTLKAQNVKFEAITFDGTDHVVDLFDYPNLQSRSAMCRMFSFLDRTIQ